MWQSFASRSRRSRNARRPELDLLEGRVVLSVAFDSVLGVGNDTASILVRDNTIDSSGNTHVTGLLYGTMDLDPAVVRPDGSDILTPRGSSDAFVAKYAPDNTLIWARLMGGDLDTSGLSTFEGGESVVVDGNGNVYVAGGFLGQAEFGPFTLTSAGDKDVFVSKLDAAGNVLWAKGWGGTTRDISMGLAVDGAGNAISTAPTATVLTDGSFVVNGFEVRKFSPTGASVWAKRFNSGESTGIATDTSGNVYVCGSFRGTVDFDPGPSKKYVTGAAGAGNGYVLKLTASGGFGWVSPFVAKTAAAPNSRASCTDIALDPSGNIVVGGSYRGQVDFNPSASVDFRLPDASSSHGFVTKLSPVGSFVWATPLGGAPIQSLAFDGAGGLYATGTFSQDFTPGYGLPAVTSNGGTDVFVTGFTGSGAVSWAVTFGGTGSENPAGISVDAAGTIYLTGFYSIPKLQSLKTVDFDPDPLGTHELSNAAFTDMFLLKLKRR